MARRSPTNERYQKHTAQAGKTRKSAASAKPKRDTATGSSSASPKKSAPARRPLLANPPTPEFKFWRRTWWGLLGTSVLFTTLSWLARQYEWGATLSNILLGVGYAAIFGALFLDFTKLRRLRREWMESQSSGKSDKKAAAKAGGKAEGSSEDDESS